MADNTDSLLPWFCNQEGGRDHTGDFCFMFSSRGFKFFAEVSFSEVRKKYVMCDAVSQKCVILKFWETPK